MIPKRVIDLPSTVPRVIKVRKNILAGNKLNS